MTTSVILDDEVKIPFASSLAEFRAWTLSDEFPQRGRIDYLDGRIEVDMSPEDLFTHGTLKMEIGRVLATIAKASGLGFVVGDRARVSSLEARLSVEPDVVFVSYEAIQQQRVRLVAKASQEAGRYVEMEGARIWWSRLSATARRRRIRGGCRQPIIGPASASFG